MRAAALRESITRIVKARVRACGVGQPKLGALRIVEAADLRDLC